MEENELTTREKLKTYFETGKYPTQSQFAEFIDSLKFKEDVLTNKEVAIIANSLATIDNGYISYFVSGIGDQKFSVVVNSKDEDDQIITMGNTNSQQKRYFFGNAPYTIKGKDFPTEGLVGTEYYSLSYQTNYRYSISRLFGNNLPTIPDGFEFGMLEGDWLNLSISKLNFEQQLNIINTKIKFVNKTGVTIKYRVQSALWGDISRSEDTVTNHYDMSDDLSFFFNSDLRGVNQSIECKVFDEDNGSLLITGNLNAGENNENVWGGQIVGVRNVRIECNYSENVD
ncbi:hypothetical protein A0O34_16635 [Chryseobacterium glaciei]|uniref:Uncharacterized protein n=1 Tax=Chryseobacterium glaciei TaxID=1685010 RepID=A0A172XYR9_9FLAO|nr:hypothetical protein [Chryseobacterium glaciei]ANF52040.1 hypothetical protein A0O34_16635 [Chryseobacterium glaciei]